MNFNLTFIQLARNLTQLKMELNHSTTSFAHEF